jgi:hypothetical protein
MSRQKDWWPWDRWNEEPGNESVELGDEKTPGIPMTIGPAKNGPLGPGSGIDLNTGRMAASLNWAVSETDHPQTEIRIGDASALVDEDLSEGIFLMNEISIRTVTSCRGDEGKWAYVMFADISSAVRFLMLWHRYVLPHGYEVPVHNLELRDEEWREEVGGDFPFPHPITEDQQGLSFTSQWTLHHEQLEEVMPILTRVMRRCVRAQGAIRRRRQAA